MLEFGTMVPNVTYILRPGGYAVIKSASGDVAIISTSDGLFLPGGGTHKSESSEQSVVRETFEECGLKIRILKSAGVADEFVFAQKEMKYYRKRCSFFEAEAIEEFKVNEPDTELIWMAPDKAAIQLHHACHRWAVTEVCGLTRCSS
jgi:8-oxo-dGTP pyrophosphatase MutT (NUDIX family)